MLIIQLTYFKHGWCFLSFSDGADHIGVDASAVLEDSMERLALSAIAALEGKFYTMTFFEEPAMTPLCLESAGEALLLHIGDKCLATTPLRYARQISAFFARLESEIGANEYHQQWGYIYPQGVLERLSQAIADYRKSGGR